MALLQPITANEGWFTGTDHVMQHTVYDDATTPAVVNITGWALSWKLFGNKARAETAIISKAVGTGIAITNGAGGICQVTIADTDTDSLLGKTYYYELRRTDAGSETVLAYGPAELLQSPTS